MLVKGYFGLSPWISLIKKGKNETFIYYRGNERRGETRICLLLASQEYLVILARRKEYARLWMDYPVTEDHRKAKLRREYAAYKTANAAP